MKAKSSKILRTYRMALINKRRKPIRIASASWDSVLVTAKEWWIVTAPSAEAARNLCLKWPMAVKDGDAIITDHGKLQR